MYKFINVWINYHRLTVRIIAFHVFTPFILLYVDKFSLNSKKETIIQIWYSNTMHAFYCSYKYDIIWFI